MSFNRNILAVVASSLAQSHHQDTLTRIKEEASERGLTVDVRTREEWDESPDKPEVLFASLEMSESERSRYHRQLSECLDLDAASTIEDLVEIKENYRALDVIATLKAVPHDIPFFEYTPEHKKKQHSWGRKKGPRYQH